MVKKIGLGFQVMGQFLTKPSSKLKGDDESSQAHLLSVILIAIMMAGVILFPVWIIEAHDFASAPYISVGLMSLFVVAYIASRTRHYRVGSLIFVSALMVMVASVLINSPSPINSRLLVLDFLLTAILLTSILLSLRATVYVTITSIIITFIAFFIPGANFLIVLVNAILIVLMSLLIILVTAIRNRLSRQAKQAQAIYYGLFEQMHDAVSILDLEGRYIKVNRVAALILGYTLEDLAKLDLALISSGGPARDQVLKRVQAGEFVPPYERTFYTRDGQPIYTEVNIELVHDQEGKPSHIQSIVHNITDRKTNEDLLRHQNDYLTTLHSFTLDLLNRRDRNDLLQSIVNHAAQIINAPYAEIMLKDQDEEVLVTHAFTSNQPLIAGDRTTRDAAVLSWQAYDTQKVVTVEDYATFPQANKIYNELSLHAVACFPIIANQKCLGILDLSRSEPHKPFTDGEIQQGMLFAQLVALLLDNINLHEAANNEIERRKKTEQSLQASEARQRDLLNAIPDLMFRFSKDGTYIDYNAPNAEMLFVPPEQFMGRKMDEILPAEIAAMHMQHIEEVINTGQESVYEYFFKPDYLESRMVASGSDEVLTIIRNVTERKALQEKSYALALETARAKVLSSFVQNASHELRTPLAVISTTLYLISKVKEDEKRQSYIDRASNNIQRLSHLLDVILMMTKLDSAMSLDCDPVNLHDDIQEIILSAQKKAAGKAPSIVFLPELKSSQIQGDSRWLKEAFTNLLDNAIRFTPETGEVTVHTYFDDMNRNIVIDFKDNGIGITDEAMPHIFERFWRQDEAHTTPGFGLGLPIALKIMEMHNGRIDVESQPGVGSIFRVSLPA